MMHRPLAFVVTGFFLLVSVVLPVAHAKLYRWVDQKGAVHYSDRVPPGFSQREREVFDERGGYVDTVHAAKTEEELREAARQAEAEARRQKAEEAQRRRDRVLFETFGSVADMELARDDRLGIVDSNILLIENKFEKLQGMWARLRERVKQIRAKGQPVTPRLAEEVDRLRTAIKTERLKLEERRKERARIQTRFDADIARFVQLNRERAAANSRALNP